MASGRRVLAPRGALTPASAVARGVIRLRSAQPAVVLGLVIAVGAFAIDMYIPGFAAIAAELRTDPGAVQLSMTSFFVALAIGQVIYGPASDVLGRRRPIFAGLAIFAAGCVAAAFAPSIAWLVAARFVQGLGVAATAVVPMAVIRDRYTGPEAARVLALAMAALSVSPIMAPVLGGLIVQFGSWRLIFAVLVAISLAACVMVARLLPESHPPARRSSARPVAILLTYSRLLRTRRFIAPVLVAACGQAGLFVFISAAPFVLVTLHGVSPTTFGLLFACHAVALIGISQFNAPMMRWLGTSRMLLMGTAGACLATVALAALVAAGMTALWPFVALTLLMFACLGLTLGPAFLTAMEPFGATAGAAAALASGCEFTLSSVVTFLLGMSQDGTARPMAGFLAASACASLAAWVYLARTPGPSRAPPVAVS